MTTQQEAYREVNRALRTGTLVRPDQCACGAKERVQAHHDDYQQPLAVRWLCRSCHVAAHKSLGTGAWNRRSPRPRRDEIISLLAANPDIEAAAQLLDISTRTLYRRMAEFEIRARISYEPVEATA